MEFNGVQIPATVATKKAIGDLKESINRAIVRSPEIGAEVGEINGSQATQAEWAAFWDRRGVADFGVLQATESRARKAEKLGMPATAALVRSLVPVREALKAVEVVKPEPAPVDPRTLENTGTCACCGRNCKLTAAGRVVDHGFRVPAGWGARSAGCLCVGELPVEVSSDGLHRVVRSLVAVRDSLRSKVTRMRNVGPLRPRDVREMQSAIDQIGCVRADIARFESLIADWRPAPLPDGRADHIA